MSRNYRWRRLRLCAVLVAFTGVAVYAAYSVLSIAPKNKSDHNRNPAQVSSGNTPAPWQLPTACVMSTPPYQELVLVRSSGPGSRDVTRINRSRHFPSVVNVRDSCRPALQEQADRTIHEYFLDGSPRPFPLSDTPKTPYCNRPVVEAECDQTVPRDASIVVALPQRNYPQAIADSLRSLTANPPVIVRNLKKHIRLLATETRSFDPSLAMAYRRGERAEPELVSFISYAQVLPIDDGSEVRSSGRTYHVLTPNGTEEREQTVVIPRSTAPFIAQIDNVIRNVRTRLDDRITHSQPGFLGFSRDVSLQAGRSYSGYVQTRAAALRQYWDLGPNLLRDDSVNVAELRRRIIDDIGSTDSRPFADLHITDEQIEDYNIWSLMNQAAEEIITVTSNALARASIATDISYAASYWWAARNSQIALACNPDSNELYPNVVSRRERQAQERYNRCVEFFSRNGSTSYRSLCARDRDELAELSRHAAEVLIDRQSVHQSCRRHYMATATHRLNRQIADGGPLSFSSTDWMIVSALSSRRERSMLYRMAVQTLITRMTEGQVPTVEDLGHLFKERLQSSIELRRSQMLTWNGFKPASSSDLEGIRRESEAIDLILQRVATHANSSPDLRRAANLALRTIAELP